MQCWLLGTRFLPISSSRMLGVFIWMKQHANAAISNCFRYVKQSHSELARSLSRGTVFFSTLGMSLGKTVLFQGASAGFGLDLGVAEFLFVPEIPTCKVTDTREREKLILCSTLVV